LQEGRGEHRAGRDEVLEAAIQNVLGRPMTDPERAAMVMDAQKVL
jgi:hypothetical protein